MDQTILFAFPRHSDFGRMASGSDVRAAALDPANVERLVEADPDDLGRELNFVARRLVSDAAFAVRYESLLMAFMDPRCFDRWAALHPALEAAETERLRLAYHRSAFGLYVLLQDVLCPAGADYAVRSPPAQPSGPPALLLAEPVILLDPCTIGGRTARVLVQIHWETMCESLALRAGRTLESWRPEVWEGLVKRALHLAALWTNDGYVHQVLWWPGDADLPAGWFALTWFPAGPDRAVLSIMRYLGTGEEDAPCIGSTCFCENPWWQQGGDYINYLFHLGPGGERHAA
ncbi:MAG TPA: hypothetical protein PLZ61_03190 [Candidatus Cryosericum sp.]|nr:hypothetical protein [Candidatus Cryosericum sp.]